MADRELDGVYIRWQDADGKWLNKCTTDLPWQDVAAWLDRREADRAYLLNYAQILHRVIQEIGEHFDIAKESSHG